MRRIVGALVALLLAGATLTGCALLPPTPCFQPMPTAIPAGIVGVPALHGPVAPNLSACRNSVKVNGREYSESFQTRPELLTLTEADLEPVGVATEKTHGAGPYVDAVVYSIRGVDPEDALAMIEEWTPSRPIVLLTTTDPFPEDLCPYFREPPENEAICPSLRVSPTPP